MGMKPRSAACERPKATQVLIIAREHRQASAGMGGVD
jgi:hypothetical protein